MPNNKDYDDLVKYSQIAMCAGAREGETLYGMGDASYQKCDLDVIYKIDRLYKLKMIDEKRYYELLEMYNHYLELTSMSSYYFSLRHYGFLEDYNEEDEVITGDEEDDDDEGFTPKFDIMALLDDQLGSYSEMDIVERMEEIDVVTMEVSLEDLADYIKKARKRR